MLAMASPQRTEAVAPLNLNRHQIITLVALCLGYAGYYLCRSDLSVITPLLLTDSQLGLTKESLGRITSIAIFAYAVGKVVSGVAVDFLGGKRLFVLAMVASVACTIVFGFGTSVTFFIVVWALNRFVQSAGWNALVKVATNWFSHHQYGRVMSFLSLSFLFGDAIGRLFLGQLIKWGWSWKAVLLAAAATLSLICVFCIFTLREKPEIYHLGGEAPEENPHNLFVEDEAPPNVWRLLKPFLTSPAFWTVAVMSFGFTLVRETFNFWLPQYLKEMADMADGEAGQWSSLFPFFGGFSVLICGWLSDNPLRGQRGLLMAVASGLLTVCLAAMGFIPPHSGPVLPVTLMCLVALLLLGPYCFLGGAISMDLGGKKGGATASGLVDSAGYFGGALSGSAVGAIAQQWGWSSAFLTLSGVSFLTCVAGTTYWLRHERAGKS